MLYQTHIQEGVVPRFATVGIPRQPLQFLAEACKLVHPMNMSLRVGAALEDSINRYEIDQGLQLRKFQCLAARDLADRCKRLQADEQFLHQSMPGHLQKILKTKRVCLFKELMQSIDYPDSKWQLGSRCVDGCPPRMFLAGR